jgi:basic membrane protein A
MFNIRKYGALLLLVAIVSSLVAGCGSTPSPTSAPAATTAPGATAAPTAAESTGEVPTVLNIAGVTITPIEEPWNTSWLQTIERLQAAKPHGLTINLDYTENVAPPDAERVMREYAESGKYQIIWGHSAYPDAVKALKDEYPDIVWALSGSGNEAFGGNAYLLDVSVHEPAYLMGMVAGMTTKTNIIGAVAAYPFPNVNGPLNAYIAGAKSVNPNIDVKTTFIESWFDPPKAKESALAQIAAGADFVYAERFGPFEAAQETGTLSFGQFFDQNSVAPDVVVSSTIARWDPDAMVLIDAWWDHVTKGTPYNAKKDRYMFSMAEGGSDLAPFYGFADKLPKDVVDAVTQAKSDIMSGKLVVPLNEGPVGEAAPAEQPTPESEGPTELNIAAIFSSAVEQPWCTAFIQMIERLQAEKPHGLTINLDYTENVAPPDAERVLQQYADTGKYQILWAHSAYYDAVSALKDQYPNYLWVGAGSGYEPMGDNAYRVDVYLHEPAYLMGIIAGKMTKTNIIGAVAAYPFANVNLPVNAFIAGAKSVNPNVEVKLSFIESWFDPPKAKESAAAQIAAGADFIYAERFGPFEACREGGVLCFGHFVDQQSLAPDVVVASPVALWDPAGRYIIDTWWDHVTNGTPYDAPGDRVVYFMKDGGSELSAIGDMVPADIKAEVEQAQADIMSGKLEVPFNEAPPEQ